MNLGFPAQERPARNVPTAGVRCVNRTRKHAASVTAYSVLRACPSIQCSTPKLHQQTTGNVESEKGLKNYGSATSYLGLFPVSQSHKLIQNFLQSLEPPFVVGGCPSISPVHLRAVRFTNLGYFFPKFLDTL